MLLSLAKVFLFATTPTVLPISLIESNWLLSTRGNERSIACLETILWSFCIVLPVFISQFMLKISAGLSDVLSGRSPRCSAVAVVGILVCSTL